MLDKEKLFKMLKKKDSKPLSDIEKAAKMNVVQSLSDHANEDLKGKIKGLKKVVVASDDSEGLKKGLKKAEEMIDGLPAEMESEMEDEEAEELEEAPEDMDADEAVEESEEDLPIEEIEAQIKKFMEMKNKKLMK